MTVAVASLDGALFACGAGQAAPAFSAQVHETVEAAEAAWRRLECEGVATPFQRLDWVRAFAANHPDEEIRVVTVQDGSHRPVLLLPVTIQRRAGCRVATVVGGRHASYAGPVMLPDWRERLGDPAAVLRAIGHQLGVDGLSFRHVPPTVAGIENPLATGGRPSASNAYSLPLGPTPDASLARGMSGSARKKLRAKERKLAALGDLRVVRAATPDEIGGVLSTFLRFKADRFGALGIDNPFASPSVQRFIRAACLTGPDGRTAAPAVELSALLVGDRVIAVAGKAVDARRASCMFIAFDPDPEVARHTPGDVLLSHVIRDATERGFAVFDLGVGDAFYKELLCSDVDPLVDASVAVTVRGRLVATLLGTARSLKRRVKRNKRAMAWLRTARRAVGQRRPGAVASADA